MADQDQQPVNIDLKAFFNQYKHAYCSTYKLNKTDLLPPYSPDDLSGIQLPNDFNHYLLNVSREFLAGSSPTGPVLDISFNTNIGGTFSDQNANYDGCMMIGTHIPNQCFHVIVTDRYHSDYGAVYLNVPNRNTKVKAWKDFTTYLTTFVMRVSEAISKRTQPDNKKD